MSAYRMTHRLFTELVTSVMNEAWHTERQRSCLIAICSIPISGQIPITSDENRQTRTRYMVQQLIEYFGIQHLTYEIK